MAVINLVMGDWSNDGHGLTDTHIIETNININEFREAYKKGCDVLGFDFIRTCCKSYEESYINEDISKKLEAYGIVIKKSNYNNKYEIDTEIYLEIYLAIVKLGNDRFRYKIQDFPTVNIDGYGLFYG